MIITTLIFYAFFFLLGAIVGSFLNVVSLRLNTGKSIAFTRSICFSCGKNLEWYELVPILSFIFQKGKCRNCKSKISGQYIIVEIITGILFVSIVNMFVGSGDWGTAIILSIILNFIIFSLLVVIVIYDLRHMIIPDSLSFLFSFFTLIYGTSFHTGWMWLLAGPILALPFALIWAISRGKWMGLGDAKLTLGIGWFLGLTLGVTALMLAFWIGAVVSILLMILNQNNKHQLSLKSEVPFAPFLIIGLTIVFFTQFDLIHLLLLNNF